MRYARDLFICHASEDKKAIAGPLADALSFLGLKVWYDEYEIRAGDSLREAIDLGLRESRMGAVILSPSLIRKGWAQHELDALVLRQAEDHPRVVLLPIWHEISKTRLARYSPTLAARKAINTRNGLQPLVDHIASVLWADAIGGGPVPPRRHVLQFFDPRNDAPTRIIYNRAYSTPTPTAQRSTTDEWLYEVRKALDTLRRIGSAGVATLRPTNYRTATLSSLLTAQVNLVSYASSKINPCTEAILERLNRRYGLGLRFLYQQDAADGKSRSVFSKSRENERVALSFQGRVLKYQENKSNTRGHDHGILIRARPSRRDARLWIVFAGCGRNASVAARLLVFDAKVGHALWARLRRAGTLGFFAAVFRTRYSPRNNAVPIAIEIIDIVDLK